MHPEQKTLRGYLLFLILACLFFSVPPSESSARTGSVEMIQPVADSEIIGKKPLFQFNIKEPFRKENLFVYLDGMDITGIIDVSPGGFSFKPVQALMSGPHQATVILYTDDGREIQQVFSFTNRHSENFDDLISANEVTARFEGLLEKSDRRLNVPDAMIDANLGSSSLVRNGQWSLSFDTNVRYFDQDIPVFPPLEKGVSVSNYLLRLEKTETDRSHFLVEIGDVLIDQSTMTLQSLSRRGGRASLTYERLTLDGFVVKTDPVFTLDSTEDAGLDGSETDHLRGLSGTVSLVKDKATFKVHHLTGGSTGIGQGLYTEGGGNSGDLTGGVLLTDFFSQKFITEIEFNDSSFDADIADARPAEDDKAYRVAVNGMKGSYTYQAAYEYYGLHYNIPGQAIFNDRKGFNLGGSRTGDTGDLTLGFSRYRNNVDDDSLQPDVYTTVGSLNYNWRKHPKFPISLYYSRSVLKSSAEPPGINPTELETDTATLSFNYLKDNLILTLQPGYSIQNDRLSDQDSSNSSIALTANYSRTSLAATMALNFNRTEFDATNEETDNYLANLQLQGRTYKDLLGYGLIGTYNQIKSNNGFKTEVVSADFEFAYAITGSKATDLLNPTIGIRTNYNRIKDHLLNSSNEEWVVLMVLTTAIPFTL